MIVILCRVVVTAMRIFNCFIIDIHLEKYLSVRITYRDASSRGHRLKKDDILYLYNVYESQLRLRFSKLLFYFNIQPYALCYYYCFFFLGPHESWLHKYYGLWIMGIKKSQGHKYAFYKQTSHTWFGIQSQFSLCRDCNLEILL